MITKHDLAEALRASLHCGEAYKPDKGLDWNHSAHAEAVQVLAQYDGEEQRDHATPPLSVLERAERFLAGFEGDTLQEGIDELLRDLRQLIEGNKSAPAGSIQELLQEGIDSATLVVGNWEAGDLAGAVHELEQWGEKAACRLESFVGDLPAASPNPAPVVVVEITGGNVSGTTILGQARLLVLDYDNGKDDEECPQIPMRGESRASIGVSSSSQADEADAEFVRQLLEVAESSQA